MVTKIQKWGNSQGLRLPRQLLADARIEVGDEVEIALREGTLVVTPLFRVRGGHDLRDLCDRIENDYQPGELDWGSPVGKEVW